MTNRSTRLSLAVQQWVEGVLGAEARIVSAQRLRGGLSSVVHKLSINRGGEMFGVVLKRPVVDDGEPGDPAHEVTQEALILGKLASFNYAPQLLAVDPTGQACGSPAILQTLLPGKARVAPKALSQWLHGLSEATHAIASLTIPADDLDTFAPWLPSNAAPPAWCSSPDRWKQTFTALHNGSLPDAVGPPRFVHRDLHPANVLFHGTRMTGIVDWVHGCYGPIEVDVSRCRVEIAVLAGSKAADTYLDLCTDLLPTYDYRWDALVAIELSPWVEDLVDCFNAIGAKLTEAAVATTLDHFIVRNPL
jgi:aminoglycoside phosphotransferase (APT) family kinase protein